MEKTELLSELNYAKHQLSSYKSKLSTLKDKLSTAETFSAECASHISSFEESISKRKSRLLSFDTLISGVKSASKYKEKMNNMLSGAEYNTTVASISHLQTSVSSEKRKIIEDIQYVEEQISYWSSRASILQYEYDNYQEEVENSVE